MIEKNTIIKQWIEKADHDLGTAQLTFIHIPKFRDTIAFHCQQAVEKYLKAYLLFLDAPFKKIHDLTVLLGLITEFEPISDEMFDQSAELQDYAIEIRYPDTILDLSEEDIIRAIQIAKDFRQHFLPKMNLKIDYEEIE